jgi:hypothetical protein
MYVTLMLRQRLYSCAGRTAAEQLCYGEACGVHCYAAKLCCHTDAAAHQWPRLQLGTSGSMFTTAYSSAHASSSEHATWYVGQTKYSSELIN